HADVGFEKLVHLAVPKWRRGQAGLAAATLAVFGKRSIAPGPVGGAGGVSLGLPTVWWDRSLLVCNGPWTGLEVPGTAPALGSRWRIAASRLSHVLLTADDGSVSRSCGRRRYDGRQDSAGG